VFIIAINTGPYSNQLDAGWMRDATAEAGDLLDANLGELVRRI